MKKHDSKTQIKIVLKALWYILFNWRSVLVVYGTIAALIGTAGTFILKNIFIPSARPIVRPIVKRYTLPLKLQIDTLKSHDSLLFMNQDYLFSHIEDD